MQEWIIIVALCMWTVLWWFLGWASRVEVEEFQRWMKEQKEEFQRESEESLRVMKERREKLQQLMKEQEARYGR